MYPMSGTKTVCEGTWEWKLDETEEQKRYLFLGGC